jgi:hypothetical protein
MEEFWNKAAVSFRSYALHFVGTTVKEDVPPEFVKRFQDLWESRIAITDAISHNSESAEEVKEFGWWFASGAFPDNWSLDQLDRVVHLSYDIDNHYFVFERLATLSEKYPFRTANLLGKLLEDEIP